MIAAEQRAGPSKPSRWNDLKLRILSAGVLAPVALLCLWVGGAALAVLVGLIAIGLAYEWLGLCRQRSSWTETALFLSLPLAVALTAEGAAADALVMLGGATIGAVAVGRSVTDKPPLALGIPYLGLGGVALVWLRQQAGSGAANVIVLLLVVWASDIGAYMVGRLVGGRRLAPAISPGKTWSGAIGGLMAAAVVGLVASAILRDGSPSWRPAALAVMIGVVSQAGDLFESHLKRQFGVKDSGSLIPGHGGLLDRLDAVLTAAPVTALLALVVGRGVVLWE